MFEFHSIINNYVYRVHVYCIIVSMKKHMCVSSDPTDPNCLLRPLSFYCLWGQNAIK